MKRVGRALAVLPDTLSYLGPRWVAYRGWYALQNRLGVLRRRLPALPWDSQPLAGWLRDASLADPAAYHAYRQGAGAPAFLFAPSDRAAFQPFFAAWDAEAQGGPISLADEFAAGRLRFFSGEPVDVGFPPDWRRDPFSGQFLPANRHWTQIGDAGPVDIKLIWEPGRFSFTFALVRAYWRTGDDRFAALFWQTVESWRQANPPQLGPHWHSGQEVALRAMAWCFGLYGFLDAPASSPLRLAMLAQMIAVSGQRVAANLDYALSQQNNHGITEAAGLWTIGLLFPELRQAETWKEQGRKVLEALARSLIYEDGAFAQHSFNYQRLALHAYLWVIRLGDRCRQPLSEDVRERVHSSANLLYQLQDAGSGRLPNYGQNDGALFLPLDNCDYADFRPLLQVAYYVSTGQRRYASGPWDEALLWFGGPSALTAPLRQGSGQALQMDERAANAGFGDQSPTGGGYYVLRSPVSFAFVRCAGFRHRPGQADMLHVDLWRRGQNIALDPGTYSYNAAPPWDNALARTSYHNTVGVDGFDQMRLASRFLWLPWLVGQRRGAGQSPWQSSQGHLAYWEGGHNGYERLPSPVWHRRGLLRLGEETWLIWDRLISRGQHRYRVHWLLLDAPYAWDAEAGRLTLATASGPYSVVVMAWRREGGRKAKEGGSPESAATLVRADPASPRGWLAPRYHALAPALSLDLSAEGTTVEFLSLFGAGGGAEDFPPVQLARDGEGIDVIAPDLQARLIASSDPRDPLVASVSLDRPQVDFLQVT